MASKGSDGQSRCGLAYDIVGLGKKCEQKRLNEETTTNAQAQAIVVKEQREKTEINYTMLILAFAAIVIVGLLVWMKVRTKK